MAIAIAIADGNTLAGVVCAHANAKQLGFRLVIGCRLDLMDAPSLLCFPTDRAAYGRLCRLLTRGKRRAGKGECHLGYADVVEHGEGQVMIALPPERPQGFDQIKGFSDYGFPLSHAASFALLVYVSAWIKCVHPDVFAAALLNSQPMGFYAPAQIVRDARDHGVEVRPVDVNHSAWDCTLEAPDDIESALPLPSFPRKRESSAPHEIEDKSLGPRLREDGGRGPGGIRAGDAGGRCALRLGFREVKGLAQEEIEAKLVKSRGGTPFRSVADLQHRIGLSRATLEKLAEADAFRSLGLDRRQALWAVRGFREETLPLFAPLAGTAAAEPAAALPATSLGEHVAEDYRAVGFSLKQHPLALLRPDLDRRRILPNARLAATPAKTLVKIAGLVLVRQRPGPASGVIFMTLEDETGIANIVVWRRVFERFRRIVMAAKLVQCEGRVQREGEVIHIVAERLTDLSPLLQRLWHPAASERADLRVQSRDFR